MAVLYFSGDQVAFFAGINSSDGNSTFTGVNAPFLATDDIEIVVPDQYIGANGDFNTGEVQFTSITVVRDGVRHKFSVTSGSKIKETGGGQVPEAGDTFFTTNDQVGAPASGPFSGLQGAKLVFSTTATFATGQTTTIDRTLAQDLNGDSDTADSGESASGQFNAGPAYAPPCYAPGTLIETADGPRAVESLRPGDLVLTLDQGPQPIRWVRSGTQALETVAPDAQPVLLRAGALGPNLPARDMIVSPQHRIFVGGAGQLRSLFPGEAFVAAKFLTGLPGIRHMTGKTEMTWVHFACDRHFVVRANGCWSESLLLGPMAQRSLTQEDRWALDAVLPFSADPDYLNGPPARPCLTGGQVRRLMAQVGAADRMVA